MHCLLRMGSKINKNVVCLTIGNDDTDTFFRYLTGYISFCNHTSSSEITFGILNVFFQITVIGNHWDNSGMRVLWVAIIDAVYISQNDKRITAHHRCNEPGELIIICKHQLGNAYRIIFIDDRYNPIAEHDIHAGTLIKIFTTGRKTFLHCKHLTNRHLKLTK